MEAAPAPSMKQRLAQRLYSQDQEALSNVAGWPAEWEHAPPMARDIYLEFADEVLALVYEPTDAMVSAGGRVHSRNPAVAWRAMIEEARK